jgi:hypothetical protein
VPNALQITVPNADSDNPLAQAPSLADAAQSSVAGTVGAGVDPLQQWLAAQRAKSAKMGLWAGSMFPTDTGYMGPGTARVEPEKMYDVQPLLDLGRIDEPASPPPLSVQQRQWAEMYDALIRGGASQDILDYHISQHPQVRIDDRWTHEQVQAIPDANVIMRAMEARQRAR